MTAERETLAKIAARRPSQAGVEAAFYRCREDARRALDDNRNPPKITTSRGVVDTVAQWLVESDRRLSSKIRPWDGMIEEARRLYRHRADALLNALAGRLVPLETLGSEQALMRAGCAVRDRLAQATENGVLATEDLDATLQVAYACAGDAILAALDVARERTKT